MRGSIGTAVLTTLLMLVVTAIWVPMRRGVRGSRATPQEIAAAEVDWNKRLNRIGYPPFESERDRRTEELARDTDLLLMRGGIAYYEPAWPVRYDWVWNLRRRWVIGYPAPPEGGDGGDWIQWPVVLIEQSVVLLLGGCCTGFAVRRHLRRGLAVGPLPQA